MGGEANLGERPAARAQSDTPPTHMTPCAKGALDEHFRSPPRARLQKTRRRVYPVPAAHEAFGTRTAKTENQCETHEDAPGRAAVQCGMHEPRPPPDRESTPHTRTANPKTGSMTSPSRSPAWGARLDAIQGAAPSGVPDRTSPP
jgi:hypothetical protein